MQRDFEREIIHMAREEGMGLVPWNSVGGGHFQSKEVCSAAVDITLLHCFQRCQR